MIDGGQYIFSCGGEKHMGVFKLPANAQGLIDVLLVERIFVDGNSVISPVLLEVDHVRVIKESSLFLQADVIVEQSIYIVHSLYFCNRKLPYRQGIEFIYCIDDERFIPFDYTQRLMYAHINQEHQYLQSRVAIVEVRNFIMIFVGHSLIFILMLSICKIF
jgi:hypothetical protein